MNDLGQNDFAIILQKRVIESAVISLDRKAFPAINTAVAAQQAAVMGGDFQLALALTLGLEDPVEGRANLAMPIPRLLYATGNPAFGPVPPGATDGQTLLSRLLRYDAVASGPTVQMIPANDPQAQNLKHQWTIASKLPSKDEIDVLLSSESSTSRSSTFAPARAVRAWRSAIQPSSSASARPPNG